MAAVAAGSSSDSVATAVATAASVSKEQDEQSVELFRSYLRVKTVSVLHNYGDAVKLLVEKGTSYGLEAEVLEPLPRRPVVLLKWAGTDPSLKSLVLNSHMDVVAADESKWSVDPWAATVRDNKIYGRGTQDMKSVGIQYLEAIGRLKAAGASFKRTIYLMYVPDEEAGGVEGMQQMLKLTKLQDMNIGFVLDEGLASETGTYKVFWGERAIWWVRVRTTGATGHGSRFIQDTAVEKLMKVCNQMLSHREEERKRYLAGCSCGTTLGDVTTINLTALRAGVPGPRDEFAINVIPTRAEAGFDCRIPVTVPLEEFKAKLDEWAGGEGVEWDLVGGTDAMALNHAATPLTPDNEWWQLFKASCDSQGMSLSTEVFPAATDGRYLRLAGYPVLGFSPMINTPVLLHDNDEHLGIDVFLQGIQVYVKLIADLASTVLPSESKSVEAA